MVIWGRGVKLHQELPPYLTMNEQRGKKKGSIFLSVSEEEPTQLELCQSSAQAASNLFDIGITVESP